MGGFNWTHQRDLLEPYVPRYLREPCPRSSETKDREFASDYLQRRSSRPTASRTPCWNGRETVLAAATGRNCQCSNECCAKRTTTLLARFAAASSPLSWRAKDWCA